ncbi:aldose 1-epimerase family protein [Actinokineospora sp. NBRC 105648]|uniref:aldose 1-epimerase family protein n=1 Tax=Actinokineospora sp. NBRC 105648 TaxID=3032206 RepID=UPI0024A50182|nr:aldose 1-epimerase family protein [Actinokineospora sp. NBRC 105648]GLZ42607.1 aldose 1-epimerase [Actinokineospora sp. NBRC 105648]
MDETEIRRAGARAVVTTTGATLRLFEVGGVPYLETFPPGEKAPMGAGAVLVPWPNRVAGAVWTHEGEQLHLEVTEAARGNASHGLVRRETWEVVEHAESSVTLAVVVDGRPGWPFPFRATMTYALDETGLTVTHGVENLGERRMPFGVGAHPYPRPAGIDVDDCVLTLAATTHLPLDPERMVPTGDAVPVEKVDRPLRELNLDDAYGGCEPGADGLVRHTLRAPGGGVEVWADAVFRWVQVYTPDSFPGREAGRAVAIEPMTCPPDALNSGTDLLFLDPGAQWSASWGLAPLGSTS